MGGLRMSHKMSLARNLLWVFAAIYLRSLCIGPQYFRGHWRIFWECGRSAVGTEPASHWENIVAQRRLTIPFLRPDKINGTGSMTSTGWPGVLGGGQRLYRPSY